MSSDQLHYRQILGGMLQTKGEIRSRKPQPEVVVKLNVDDNEAKVIKELLGTESLVFKIVAVDSPDGTSIALHIRLKQ
jgi:hypothetical protein